VTARRAASQAAALAKSSREHRLTEATATATTARAEEEAARERYNAAERLARAKP
jgi:hypothetical protein